MTTQISILYTGDVHGRIDRLLRAVYLAQAQRHDLNATGRHVILLDAGDVEDRALLESDLSKGAALYRVLKTAGYDASAVGNGAALSYGPQVLETIAHSSELPLLCANLLTLDDEPVPGTQPTLILVCGPIRVGLIGLTAEMGGAYSTMFPITMPDVFKTARDQIDALRQRGCQVIGVLSHLGYEMDIQLARACWELDFIIGGHSHTTLRYPTDVNGIPVCHAGEYAQYLGQLDLTLDHDGRITNWAGQLLPVNDSAPQHLAALQEWQAIQSEARDLLGEPVGYLNAGADLASDRACGMGQLLADALRARMDTEIGLCITGHIRDSLSEGDVTVGDLMRVCRSAANPAAVYLSGAQIIRILEHGADPLIWQQVPMPLRGTMVGLIQVSGLSYSIDWNAGPGKRVSDVRIGNHPINLHATYRVAATDYELSPELGYVSTLDPAEVEYDAPWILREVLHDHFRRFKPLTPALRPRIQILSQGGETVRFEVNW
jgi:2',3'-cyclic-nucleotide 2'-phosphodiesterase (5'-nucleotidase family)